MNSSAGSIVGNASRIKEVKNSIENKNISLLVFPEMALSGRPSFDKFFPMDTSLLQENILSEIAENETRSLSCATIIGCSLMSSDNKAYNVGAILKNKNVHKVVCRHNEPSIPGEDFSFCLTNNIFEHRNKRILLTIGNELSSDSFINEVDFQSIDFIISISASPYFLGQKEEEILLIREAAMKTNIPIVRVNAVGANGSFVFRGGSFVTSPEGAVTVFAKEWEEDFLVFDIEMLESFSPCPKSNIYCLSDLSSLYFASVIGIRDYVNKKSFSGAVLGLSGGVDSALTTTMAVDALGSDNVICLMIKSQFTSNQSLKLARDLANRLNVRYYEIDMEPVINAFNQVIGITGNSWPDNEKTSMNLQARIRALILMSVSNSENLIMLNTGNKSELLMGYSTLYGDSCGGCSPLGDILKSTVFKLCINRNDHVPSISIDKIPFPIPEEIIDRCPTAELKENQYDSDDLPPYPFLDSVLEKICDNLTKKEILSMYSSAEEIAEVEKIFRTVRSSAFKRLQSAPAFQLFKSTIYDKLPENIAFTE